MRHSASIMVQPQVHFSARMNLSAASLRAPETPCQSTPGSSVAVCHVPSARHRAPSRKKGATLRILTLLLSLKLPGGPHLRSLPARRPFLGIPYAAPDPRYCLPVRAPAFRLV